MADKGGISNNKSSLEVKVSSMATAETHGEDSPYFAGWREYERNPYHPQSNPSGIIQMGLAENQVSFDLVEEWLTKHPQALMYEEEEAKGNSLNSTFRNMALFQDYHGLPAFKKALASFMKEIRGGKVEFNTDQIVLTAGATAATELLTFCLANRGDAFLIPTPYYPGFDRDMRWRTGVEIIPVQCSSFDNFEIKVSALEVAYGDAQKRNITVRGVLVTNPWNPLGTTLQAKTLKNLLLFVSEKNIHLICDEIYSASVFSSPDFVSIGEVIPSSGRSCDRERVHIVYSLSKDLGLPGFRVGAIYSCNDLVITTATRMSSFCLPSSQTQHMLACMLSDEDFINHYIDTTRKRLRQRHSILLSGLQNAGINCLESNAGLFCWVNFIHLMSSQDLEGELKLWEAILHEMGLNVSPGSSFHCMEPGWFRVCFANISEDTLRVSLDRIKTFIKYTNRDSNNHVKSDQQIQDSSKSNSNGVVPGASDALILNSQSHV